MSIKLKDTIYDLINNSDKLDGKDSSAFSLTTHTHSEYLTELPSHTHNYASTVKIGSTEYNSSNNVISLPTYPTLSSLGAAPSSHTHDYLSLSGGTLTGQLTIKSSTTSGDTPKLYFQRGTETDSYYDNYIYNTGGGLTFGYSNGGTNYDLVKITSTTLRPNENNKYYLGSETHKWIAVYADTFNGTATSVSKSLKFGNKTYNGSAEETITAADLGAVTLTGTQYISGAKYFQRDAANGLYIENTGETNTSKYIAIRFRHSGANVSGIASYNTTDSYLYRINAAYNVTYKIWDEGNFTPSNYLLLSSYTASDVLTKLKTVDGGGSGLDADLLDGVQLSGLFTELNTTNDTNLSITIGGIQKTLKNLNAYRTDFFTSKWNYSSGTEFDLNTWTSGGIVRCYGDSNLLLNKPSGFTYGNVLCLSEGTKALTGQLAWAVNSGSTTDTTKAMWFRVPDSSNGYTYAQWHQIAFTDSNIASATKLQTARTIWGQSFDGTGNVDGIIKITGIGGAGISQYKGSNYVFSLGSGSGSAAVGTEYGILQLFQNGSELIRLYAHGNSASWINAGNVGIGTTAPAQKLHVVGTIKATAYRGGNIAIECDSSGSNNSGGNNGNIDSFGAKLYLQSVSTTDLIACYGGGNVGIGTTSPKGKLHVEGNSYLRGTIYVTNPDATTINQASGKIKFNSINTDDTYRSPYIQAIHYGNYSRKRLGIFQSNATNYTDDFVEVLSILPNGNIGIGTTSPGSKLQVNGSLSCSTFYIGDDQITFIT